MPATNISIPSADDGTIPSYLTTAASGAGPGVVLISTILGVERDMQTYADDLARHGFACSAPDMFWRDEDPGALPPTEDGWKRAHARNGRSDLEQGMKDLADVIADLKNRPACNGKIAVMGFCFGGPYALLGAARLGIDAGISFHGSHVGDCLSEASKIRCPMSFHYGDNDAVAPMEEIERIRAEFDKLDSARVYVYPGCGHGYMQPNRGAGYDEAAAKVSWERALEVLKGL